MSITSQGPIDLTQSWPGGSLMRHVPQRQGGGLFSSFNMPSQNQMLLAGLGLMGGGLQGNPGAGLGAAAQGIMQGGAMDRAAAAEERQQGMFDMAQQQASAWQDYLDTLGNPNANLASSAGNTTLMGQATPVGGGVPSSASLRQRFAMPPGGPVSPAGAPPAMGGSMAPVNPTQAASRPMGGAGGSTSPVTLAQIAQQNPGMIQLARAMGPQAGGSMLANLLQARMAAQGPGKAATDIGKLRADLAAGFITQADFDRISQGMTGPGSKEVFANEDKLRDEFVSQSKDFKKVRDAYGRIVASASDPSAAGDLALIFNYMKVLDPGSTVREGEAASVQNAGGVPAQVRNLFNRVQTGQKLAPEQRADFANRARMLYDSQLRSHEQLRGQYSDLAQRYNVSPENVVLEYRTSFPEVGSTAAPVQIPVIQETPATPEATSEALQELSTVDLASLDEKQTRDFVVSLTKINPEGLSEADQAILSDILDQVEAMNGNP